MATKKKTKKATKKVYRGLTVAEMNSENAKRQAYVRLLNKLKSNEKIAPEIRAVLRKMHKAALSVVDYSGLLTIENSKYSKR